MFQSIRIASVVVGIAVTLCVTQTTGAGQTESPAGDWIGGLHLGSQPVFLRITVGPSGEKGWTANVILQPVAAISPINTESRRITDSWRDARVAVDGTSWSVAAGTVPNRLEVDVRRGAHGSIATVSFQNQTAQTVLHHLAAVDLARERQYTGAYVLPSGQRIYVWRPSATGPIVGGVRRADGFLTFLEEATGRSGNLYPVAGDSYIAGPTSVLPDPVRVRATFRQGADGTRRLTWQETGKKEVVAPRSKARREEIQIKGPGGLIGCDVLTPAGDGKHPAAVLVPGAGANTRYDMHMIAQVFSEHGIAALACDKRGTGTSEGDWRLTSFEQQAEDVAAGVRFLQQRPEIDATRVGVFGYSEGAWVAPIAVAANPRVAFLILAAPPVTSRRESVLMGNEERLRQTGASADEIARHRQFYERYQQAIIDNDAAVIAQLWRQYAGASWLPANMPTAQTLNDWSWQRARLTWRHEPGPVLSTIRCPILAVWGAEDESFPPAIHRPRFEQSMRAGGNSDYTSRVIANANHSFLLVAPSFVEVTGYAPEYFRTLVQWLRAKKGNSK